MSWARLSEPSIATISCSIQYAVDTTSFNQAKAACSSALASCCILSRFPSFFENRRIHNPDRSPTLHAVKDGITRQATSDFLFTIAQTRLSELLRRLLSVFLYTQKGLAAVPHVHHQRNVS